MSFPAPFPPFCQAGQVLQPNRDRRVNLRLANKLLPPALFTVATGGKKERKKASNLFCTARERRRLQKLNNRDGESVQFC